MARGKWQEGQWAEGQMAKGEADKILFDLKSNDFK
jgi:hypothetical protein